MKNKLQDLNDHLFAQLERLNDETVTGDALAAEVKRASAITEISGQIISGADVRLRAAKLYAEYGTAVESMLPQIGGKA